MKQKTTKIEPFVEKFIELVSGSPKFNEIYQRHKDGALKTALLEFVDSLTDDERASMKAACESN